ncbi:MAG: glycosyltransferase family 39 protein [Bryobacterales bacterium]|nr:glycosyltransferase family 39 protein [Bryobacterales bacterium]
MKKHLLWLMPLAVGAALRFRGITFGWPLTSNLYIRPDESLVIVSGVTGSPSTYAYPALFLELAAGLFRMMGGDPATGFGLDPSPYFVALRCVAALFGTLTIGLVYLIARRVLGGPWPMLAALVYAVSPLAVRDAHYAVTDIPSVCFQTAVVWFALRYVDAQPGRAGREFWCAAAALGLSMNTKYAGVLLLSVLLYAVWMRSRDRGERVPWRWLGGAVAGFCGLFAAVNLTLLMNWARAWEEIWSIVSVLYFWQPGDPQWTLQYGLGQIVKPLGQGSGGWIGLGLTMAGLAYAAWKRDRRLLLIAQPVLATFIILLPFQHTVPYRYLLPALPGIAVLSVVALESVRRWPAALLLAGIVFLVMVETRTSVRFVELLSREDSRGLAGIWIRGNIDPTMPIVWLGGPEAEPQFVESAASVGRRIEFAYRRYGPFSGAIVSAPYQLMEKAKREAGIQGWEVYRNPPAGQLPANEFALVTTEYPLRMTRFKMPIEEAALADIAPPHEIRSLRWDTPGCQEFELDLIDAWFLPFRPLECVERPGPNVRIRRVRIRPDYSPEAALTGTK